MSEYCPMMDEDGNCQIRVAIFHARCFYEEKFRDTTCKPSNCPVWFMVETMQKKMLENFSLLEDKRNRQKLLKST